MKINGMKFELMSSHRTKADAKVHAEYDKHFGYTHYRVKKVYNMWVVYQTKQKRRKK